MIVNLILPLFNANKANQTNLTNRIKILFTDVTITAQPLIIRAVIQRNLEKNDKKAY